MGYRAALLNFSKGEISPEVRARFDLSAYQAAAAVARNVKIRRTGGLSKRTGTRFVVEALSSSSHLIPFQFSDEQAYVLEMAQEMMRPLAYGGAILEDEGLTVTTISSERYATVIAPYHGYTVGQSVYFTDIEGMSEINYRFIEVLTVIDANTFIIDFDTRGLVFGGDTGDGIVRTGPPTPPPAPPPTPTPTPDPEPPKVGRGSGGGYDNGGTYRIGVNKGIIDDPYGYL